ncbi:hypothetical protein L6R52_13025 [Myxococcota bacterium]|nr:hypothetical protein [Myxococcota bacterium]
MKLLDEAVLVDPITHVNFFNGRLLTAEDLRTERRALARKARRLGRAVGGGVVEGLWVEPVAAGGTAVRISAGLAISPEGDVIELPSAVDLTLAKREERRPNGAADFLPCDRTRTGDVLMARGVYLLVASPTETLSADRAPQAGLGHDGRAYGCEARYVYQSVAFRLVRVELVDGTFPDLSSELLAVIAAGESDSTEARAMRRNLLAHFFLGTLSRRVLASKLFTRDLEGSPLRTQGPIDALRARGVLTACEVPLALVSWLGPGLDFVDVWAVRRGLGRGPTSADWPVPGDERGRRDREAAFLQFQRHVAELAQTTGDLASLRARECLRFVPSVSFLPLSARAEPDEVVPFFDGVTTRAPTFADSAVLDELHHQSLDVEPFDLQSEEFLWLYVPWQLAQAEDAGRAVTPVLVVASPHLAERGLARFDLARWDYSNYAG